MNQILFYDCFAGISGDMNLGALIDLGVDAKYLLNELKKTGIDEFEVKYQKDIRRGITGTRVDVIVKEPHHKHGHEHHHHSTFKDIKSLIEKSGLSEFVKSKSISIFQKLAETEGKIHSNPVDEVHFHEVGAVDSIVDIIGAAICIDYLKPSKIIASRIELGSGLVKCAHGMFPVPAPATAELLIGIPVKSGNVPFEATTPTGAAILTVFVDEFVEKTQFITEKTGYGIGHKDSEIPNVLRVQLCTDGNSAFKSDSATIIECNIDDMNPEVYDYLIEKLFHEGADDVFINPIIMKKSRPAIIFSVLSSQAKKDKLIKIILNETSSIGLRTYDVTKHMLEREIIEFHSSFGKVKIKKSWSGKDIIKFKPEYEDCRRIAIERNLSLMDVINTIQKEINGKL
jgi:pyridinium-3,5-bisthiocarboxylic acid mononucleotide nickel chelatase